ncbi:MAG: carboxylesterase family protein, partial [Oscillospiraceae bacterium]|nr:carboxylesterase family protein [Oscillospiraceae bacterium]
MSEDSLALNIWTPANSVDDNLPVYVWIFGGGLTEGYSHEMEFDGEHMASRGIILVSIAYRLNVFGFLAHPDLTREQPDAPANFGFLDQAAGIAWVKRNIKNFGGDPNNITIGGQSAGGISVLCQMTAPQTEGLFQKATIQSSAGGDFPAQYPLNFFRRTGFLADAEKQGAYFVKEYLGCDTIAQARKLDGFFVRDKFLEYMNKENKRFVQCADGKFVTKDPVDSLLANEQHDVPFLLGYTTDEINYLPQGDTIEAMTAWADKNFGGKGREFIELAAKKAGSWDVEAVREAGRVNANEVSNYIIAELYKKQGRTAYTYQFNPTIPGDDAGSFHSSDLWFSFETLASCWRPFDGHHYDVARLMCNYWTNFVKNGDPNGKDRDGKEMPFWPKYNDDQRNLDFYDEVGLDENGPDELLKFVLNENLKYFGIK